MDAHIWLATNSNISSKYLGKWVAVVEGKIIASATSLKELLKAPSVDPAKQLITQIPSEQDVGVILFRD